MLKHCGAVVLTGVFTAATLTLLREHVALKLKTAGGPPAEESTTSGKYDLPGVRGQRRREQVLPFKAAVAAALLPPRLSAVLGTLVGSATPAVEFVAAVTSWAGADAQDWHRDADAAMEAGVLAFVPLVPTDLTGAGAGPPELCPCTHRRGDAEACGEPPAVPMHDALGSVVLYNPVYKDPYGVFLK